MSKKVVVERTKEQIKVVVAQLKKRWRLVTFIIVGLIVVVTGIFSFRSLLERHKEDPVLAVVNGYKIRVSHFKRQMAALPDFYQAYAVANRSQFLRDLIDRELIYQKARWSRQAKSPQLKERLEELKKDLLVQEYVQKEILEKSQIPQIEMLQYYKTHPLDFVQPASIHLYEIMVTDLKTAQTIIKKFQGGEDFEDLARKFSESPSKARGGDLGFVREGMLPVQLEQIAFQLPPNKISPPIKTEGGYYLLMARQKIPSRQLSYEESIPLIKKILISKHSEESFKNFLRGLRAKSRIKVLEENLENIQF